MILKFGKFGFGKFGKVPLYLPSFTLLCFLCLFVAEFALRVV